LRETRTEKTKREENTSCRQPIRYPELPQVDLLCVIPWSVLNLDTETGKAKQMKLALVEAHCVRPLFLILEKHMRFGRNGARQAMSWSPEWVYKLLAVENMDKRAWEDTGRGHTGK
jgi:hypothetical protein